MPKNVLVIGSGGREHALIYALKKSSDLGELYIYPGNAGINKDAKKADISSSSNQDITEFCQQNSIDLVVIGPEQPLVDGLADYLEQNNIKTFGPNKQAAQIEGSKDFMKAFITKYNIPTAKYQSFESPEPAKEYVREQGAPIVVKTDGLAAGKGVTVAMTESEAIAAIDEAFAGKFGEAGKKIVIEEFLEGEEASFFVICDGENFIEFGDAQDHKAAYEGDKGPNTGGMGTYSPAPIVTPQIKEKVIEQIIKPTLAGFKSEGIEYKGFLFAGLMIDKLGNPRLLEYNIRMGDPETQSILPRLKADFLEILLKASEGNLAKLPEQQLFEDNHAVCVVYATEGYPGSYKKGHPIALNQENTDNNIIFHAGTALDEAGSLVSNGGRVLGVTGTGKNF
jgi:phosphoribosylamine--glycine ligase